MPDPRAPDDGHKAGVHFKSVCREPVLGGYSNCRDPTGAVPVHWIGLADIGSGLGRQARHAECLKARVALEPAEPISVRNTELLRAVGVAPVKADLHPAISEVEYILAVGALTDPILRLLRVGTENDVGDTFDVLPQRRKGVIWGSQA